MQNEPFVSADVAASHLGIRRRFLLSLARQGIAGAYALGTGLRLRNVWVFRLSELSEAIARRTTPLPRSEANDFRIGSMTGSPR